MAAYCAVHVTGLDANRTIKDELTAAMMRRSARRRISVTDLVNPRQSYFARTNPEIQPSADRLQLMMAGTGFHELFGRAVAGEEFVEQLVEFEEVVGKIDIFEDTPLELKTTSSIPTDALVQRPGHVEQLAMYCVMVRKPAGHLVYYRRAEFGREPGLLAYDVEVSDADHITREMLRRRDVFRHALVTGDPTPLPRCEWHGRDCAYEAICGCDGAPAMARMVSDATVRLRQNPGLVEALRTRIDAVESQDDTRRTFLNDLVFPRKAAYRLTASGEAADDEDTETRMADLERRGFEDTLKDAIWYGTPGACKRVRVAFGPIRASVLLYKGIPTLLRTTRRREMIPRDRVVAEAPHYIDRIGFECALIGSDRGRIVVYYSSVPGDKFMVYDLWFKDLAGVTVEMQRRLQLLEAGAPPGELPACQPAWMSRFCKFASTCGCGSQEAVRQAMHE